MKVQCEVCNAQAASVFCCADEVALCDACDLRVHRSNRFAGNHRRLSLLHPSSSPADRSPPLCDVCKEKRGFLFCQEDRAILCRDCDLPIHSATDLTRKHNRFLLTGIRLSAGTPAADDSCPMFATEEVKSSGEMDHTRESLLLGFGGGIPIGLPRPPPERVSGGGGEGSRLEEEVEMERSSSDKRPWISIRYL